jgi:hypothetical protein
VLKINRLARRRFLVCAVAMAAFLLLPPHQGAQAQARAQSQAQSQDEAAASRGENFSAKPAPALFASIAPAGAATRAAGPGQGQSQASLAGFLREHYTNSRESAAAIAAYLVKIPERAGAERGAWAEAATGRAVVARLSAAGRSGGKAPSPGANRLAGAARKTVGRGAARAAAARAAKAVRYLRLAPRRCRLNQRRARAAAAHAFFGDSSVCSLPPAAASWAAATSGSKNFSAVASAASAFSSSSACSRRGHILAARQPLGLVGAARDVDRDRHFKLGCSTTGTLCTPMDLIGTLSAIWLRLTGNPPSLISAARSRGETEP